LGDSGTETLYRVGKSFQDAVRGPYLQTGSDKLRIFIGIDGEYLAPTHSDYMYAMVVVWGPIGHVLHARPSNDHGGVPRPALDPDVSGCQLQGRSKTTQTLKPAAQRFAIVTLAAKGVIAAKPMIDLGPTPFQDRCVILLIHAFEVFARDVFYDPVVHIRFSRHKYWGLRRAWAWNTKTGPTRTTDDLVAAPTNIMVAPPELYGFNNSVR
jgi:hypothetical protein